MGEKTGRSKGHGAEKGSRSQDFPNGKQPRPFELGEAGATRFLLGLLLPGTLLSGNCT